MNLWWHRLLERTVCVGLGHRPVFELIEGRTVMHARVRGERSYCARCGVTITSRAEREPLPR